MENKKSNINHDRLQADCYQWHYKTYPEDRHLLHANLSNSVGGRYGAHNKAIGVKKGRADLQLFRGGRLYLFEFKVGSDAQKPDQKAFQEANQLQGASYFIIRSQEEYEDVIKQIHEYGYPSMYHARQAGLAMSYCKNFKLNNNS